MGTVTNSRFKVTVVDLSDDTIVGAGATNTQNLQPISGKIYEILDIYWYIADPVGSGAGTHKAEILSSVDNTIMYTRGKADFGNDIKYSNHQIYQANNEKIPSAAQEFSWRILALWASNTYYPKFTYSNDTNVAQTGNRVLKILVKEHTEV